MSEACTQTVDHRRGSSVCCSEFATLFRVCFDLQGLPGLKMAEQINCGPKCTVTYPFWLSA